MLKINKSEFAEEIRYSWECPSCGDYNLEFDDPSILITVMCECCGTDFEIEQTK